MFRNYFKTAWRSIVRGKVYSLLNLLGLATGMAVALLIGLWVYYQSSYDRFVPSYDRAHQVRFNYSDNGVIRNQAEVCLPLGDALKKDIPEKDALTQNPFAAAEPTLFLYEPSWSWKYTMRLAPTVSTSTALAKLKPICEKYGPDNPFTYSFVDETYASKFALEMLIGRLAGIFAGLAIFISCLGLFGLAAYTAERTREIGIRKVLGASVSEVLVLLSGDFVLLVGISCLIASPVAYYFLHQWLAGYYYRITISPLVFVAAAVLALVITAITVGFQSVRSAMQNPVNSLRTD